MNDLILSKVESKVITLREQKVILAHDVAELYAVETREVVQAIKNNPEKFPEGYIFELTHSEKDEVIKFFDNPAKLRYSPSLPKAFTEKGLYMLATILNSNTPLSGRMSRDFRLENWELRISSKLLSQKSQVPNKKEYGN